MISEGDSRNGGLQRPHDARDPEMREHLEAIRPLNDVDKNDVPGFVVQSRSGPDRTVPATEAGAGRHARCASRAARSGQ